MASKWYYAVKRGCTGCGECALVCMYEAVSLAQGSAKIDAQACVGCGECAGVCPAEAIVKLDREKEEK